MEIILNPAEEKLNQDCIKAYGLDAQLDQYQEECIEAALAIRKYFRAKMYGTAEDVTKALYDLYGEIVDVTNMSIQMKIAFVPEEQFKEIWTRKITRQIKRVYDRLSKKGN